MTSTTSRIARLIVIGALAATLAHAGPITWEMPVQEIQAEPGVSSVAIVFRFRNDGGAPVTFGRVSPGCGCTVGELPRATWQPGETGEVTAHFRVGDFEGRKRVAIRVAYESPVAEPDQITFTVDVRPWADVKPRLLWWARGAAAESKEIEIAFLPDFRDATVAITGENPAGFVVTPRPAPAGRVAYVVAPAATDAPQSQQLHLRFLRPDGRTVERTIFLRVM